MESDIFSDTKEMIAIAIIVFILIQTVQATTVTFLIEIASSIFNQVSKNHRKLSALRRFILFSVALLLLLLNSLFQIAIWAASFIYIGQFSNFREAFYHSSVNFATLGYGDIVMDSPWRVLGALEAISGVLMLGLATATLSNVYNRIAEFNRKGHL